MAGRRRAAVETYSSLETGHTLVSSRMFMRPWVVRLAVLTGALSLQITPGAMPKARLSAPIRAAVEFAIAPAPRTRPQTVVRRGHASSHRECIRSRKRLWVEGQGWIVRRLTTCSYEIAGSAVPPLPHERARSRTHAFSDYEPVRTTANMDGKDVLQLSVHRKYVSPTQ
jgi:hypothetical protein